MADAAWRQGRPAEIETGLAQVLLSYATQGGQLFGARRWTENPLTLTHVRWQGVGGATLEAFRQPGSDDALSQEEREVWVQIAVNMPIGQAASSNVEIPWLPILVEQEQAAAWAALVRHAQARRRSQTPPSFMSSAPSAPQLPSYDLGPSPQWTSGGNAGFPGEQPPASPMSNGFHRASGFPGSGPSNTRPPMPDRRPPRETIVSAPRQNPTLPPLPSTSPSFPSHSFGDSDQWSQGTGRSSLNAPEVAVLLAVEVELPSLLDGVAVADYRRDFARDVALHFGRAARIIPQVREVRGWMRGDRLVLGARFVVAMGTRGPTRAEVEGVAQALADVLAQRTLPYTRLGSAEPGEWMQGAPLPE